MALDATKIAFLDSTEALFRASENWDGLLSVWEMELRGASDPELVRELAKRIAQICVQTDRRARAVEIIEFAKKRMAGERASFSATPLYRTSDSGGSSLLDELLARRSSLGLESERFGNDAGISLRLESSGITAPPEEAPPPSGAIRLPPAGTSPSRNAAAASSPPSTGTGHAATAPPADAGAERDAHAKRDSGKRGRARRPQGKRGGRQATSTEAPAEQVPPPSAGNRAELLAASRRAELHGNWQKLAEAERELASTATSAEEQLPHLLKLGAVCAKQLCDLDTAIEAYRCVLQLDPNHTRALDALRQLYALREEWPELIDILESQIARSRNAERSVPLLLEVAEVYADVLCDIDEAIATYERVRAIDPRNEAARSALARLRELG